MSITPRMNSCRVVTIDNPGGTPLVTVCTIDALRILLDATRPKAKMTRDAAQTFTTGVTPIKVAFDNEEYDVGGIADTGTGRFTIQEDGKYLVTASISFPGVDDGERVAAYIYLNGASVTIMFNFSPSSDKSIFATVTDTFDLSATDYIEMYSFQDSGSSQNTPTTAWSKPRMSVVKV